MLVDIAALLREETRQIDSVGRLGGEEFAILVPEADAEDALVLAERIRAGVADLRPEGVAVTGSFGVAAAPGDAMTAEDLLRNADRALYVAKHAGRDRCERYAPPARVA